MGTARLLHRGKRSWWNGTVTSLCGLTVAARDVEAPLFTFLIKRCPTCEAIHQLAKGK
jgi:hypothetical protein